MNVLLIDTFGDALDLALRAKEAGHNVTYWVDQTKKKYNLVGKGLIFRVDDFKIHMNKADFIILCDNVKNLSTIESYKRENPNKVIFGTNRAISEWESDRMLGMKILEKHGIECPVTKICSSYDEAVTYVKKRDTRLVCKPCGDGDKALSYCSKGPEDMLFMLERWRKLNKLKDNFILQDFIEGIEFAVGAYLGSDGFAGGWEENFEHKKLMVGEVGPSTGELGTVLQITNRSKLANQVLKPLEKTLIRAGYIGDIDINCIVDDKGKPYPLEFTARMGYPALQIQTPLFPDDPIQWMYDLARWGYEPQFKKDIVSLGIAMCISPFPYEPAPLDLVTEAPIFGVTAQNKDKIHPYHIMKGEKTEWATAGQYALVITGTSNTVRGAKENATRTLKQLVIPGDILYRTDIGDKLSKNLPVLQKHGYATSFTY